MNALRKADPDKARFEVVQEEIDEGWGKDAWVLCEPHRAWDAIHRYLTDDHLGFRSGSFPLHLSILNEKQIFSGDDYIVSLVTSEKRRDLAEVLQQVSAKFIGSRYSELPSDYQARTS